MARDAFDAIPIDDPERLELGDRALGHRLEDALRQLCRKNGIPEGDGIEAMNVPLRKAGVYGVPQQQQITAWAAIRNKADHGRFSEYSLEEVRVMHLGVSGFVTSFLGA